MDISEKLTRYLKEKNITRADLAKSMNMEYMTLNNMFNRAPSIKFLDQLMKKFPDLDMNWLLREDKFTWLAKENGEDYKHEESKEEIIAHIKYLLDKLEQK